VVKTEDLSLLPQGKPERMAYSNDMIEKFLEGHTPEQEEDENLYDDLIRDILEIKIEENQRGGYNNY